MTIKISAILPTYNRATYLSKAVQSLVDQTMPADQFEILVVDNCSTDHTRKVVIEDFAGVSNLRYVYEPVLGLNQARNTGWQQAHGEYVAYLDDDAIAAPQWLEKIVLAFETVEPTPGCVGGKVEAIWEIGRPQWLSKKLELSLTILDHSEVPTLLDHSQVLVGANMAFPRSLLEDIDGFQVGLDRTGTKLLSNGEILLEQKLRKLGYDFFYDPEIAVRHYVPASRLKQSYFIRRRYWQGVSDAIVHVHHNSPSLFERLHLGLFRFRQLLLSPQRLAYLIVPTNDPEKFVVKCSSFETIGEILGLLGVTK